jgi:hypothetical protein
MNVITLPSSIRDANIESAGPVMLLMIASYFSTEFCALRCEKTRQKVGKESLQAGAAGLDRVPMTFRVTPRKVG